MYLYLITQKERNGYDTYDAAIVAANSPREAKQIHPHADLVAPGESPWEDYDTWASKPSNVIAKCIGTAVRGTNSGVILTSFCAG